MPWLGLEKKGTQEEVGEEGSETEGGLGVNLHFRVSLHASKHEEKNLENQELAIVGLRVTSHLKSGLTGKGLGRADGGPSTVKTKKQDCIP